MFFRARADQTLDQIYQPAAMTAVASSMGTQTFQEAPVLLSPEAHAATFRTQRQPVSLTISSAATVNVYVGAPIISGDTESGMDIARDNQLRTQDFKCEKHKLTKDILRGMPDALQNMLKEIDNAISRRKSMNLYDSKKLTDEDIDAIDHQRRAYDILSRGCMCCSMDEWLVWDFETLYYATLGYDESLRSELVDETRRRCLADEFVGSELLDGETVEEMTCRIAEFRKQYSQIG
ncbi:hypothetical protein DFJ77DRAFT_467342 [Powellomyces hirtus]|nr:hypothetical protein DFJ77DRAFT_467342 [Powellomyces hirtus]